MLDGDEGSMDPLVDSEPSHPKNDTPCKDCEEKSSDEVPSTSRVMSDRQRQTDSGHYSVHDLEDCSDNDYEDNKIKNTLEYFPEVGFADREFKVSFCDEIKETSVTNVSQDSARKNNTKSDICDKQELKIDQKGKLKKIKKGDKNGEKYTESSPYVIQQEQYSSPRQLSPVENSSSNVNPDKNSDIAKNQRPSNIMVDSTKLRSERKQTRFKGTDAKVNTGSTSKVINQSTGGTQGSSQPIKVNNDRSRIDNDQAACVSTEPMLRNAEILTGEVISKHSRSSSGQAINLYRNGNTIDTREGLRQNKQCIDDNQKNRATECKRTKSHAGTLISQASSESKNSHDDITSHGNERHGNRSQYKTAGSAPSKNVQGHVKKSSNKKHSNDLTVQKHSARVNSIGSDEDGTLSNNEPNNRVQRSNKSVKINEGSHGSRSSIPRSPSSFSDTGSECSVASTESGKLKNKVKSQNVPACSKKSVSRIPDGSSGYSQEDNQERRRSIEKGKATGQANIRFDAEREAAHREKMAAKLKSRSEKTGEKSMSRPQSIDQKKSPTEGPVEDKSVRKKVRPPEDGKPRKPPCQKCREEARARKLARRAEKERLRAESESRQAAGRDDTRIRRSEGEGGESYTEVQRDGRRRDNDHSSRDSERDSRQQYETSRGAIPKSSRKHSANHEEEKYVRVKSRSSSRHHDGEGRSRGHGSSSKERHHRRSTSLDESNGHYEKYDESQRKHRESSKHRKHPKQVTNRSYDDYDQESMPTNFVRRSEKYIDLSIPLENTYNYPTADENAEIYLGRQNEPCENDDIFEPEGAVGLDASQYGPYPESPQPLVAPPVIMRDRSQMWKDIESGYATLPRNKSKHRRSRSSPRNSAIYEGEESESSGHQRSHSSSSRNSMLIEDAFEPSDTSGVAAGSDMNSSPLRIAEPYKEKRDKQKKRRSQSSSSRNSSVIEETEFDITSSTGSKDTTNRSSVGSETSSDYVTTNTDGASADIPLENVNEAAGWGENEKVGRISMNEALKLDLKGQEKSNVSTGNVKKSTQHPHEMNVPSSDPPVLEGAQAMVDTVSNHDMMGRVVFGTSQLIDACCSDVCSTSVPHATLPGHSSPRNTYFQSGSNMADVRLTPAQRRHGRGMENDFFSPQLQQPDKPKSATFPGRMRRRHKAGNNFDDINETEPTGLIPDEVTESASLPRNFPRQAPGRYVDNAGFEINNQISYQRSVSHMNECLGEEEMYAIVDTTTVTLQQSLIMHTRNATAGNQPNCCVAQCSCGNPNCNLAMTNGNLCTTCGAVTIGCIVHEAPPYITLPRTGVDGTLENAMPNNVLLAHQNVYSTGPRHFARRPLCSVINTGPIIDPMGQMIGGNLQYGFPFAQNYPPFVLCSCNSSLTTGIHNATGHQSGLQCNVPLAVSTTQQVVLQVSQAVSTVQSNEISQGDTRSNFVTLRRGSRPRIAGPDTEVTVSQQGSPRLSVRQETNRTPVRAPVNRSTEQTNQSETPLMPVTLHNNIESQSGVLTVRSGNECRSLSPERNLLGQNLDTDSSCDESAGSCISMIQPKYSTLPWNFVCRPKKQPNTEKVKKNLPIPDRQVNTVPRRQISARSQLKSLWQKLRKSWTRALEDETNVNINSSDNRVANTNHNELRNEITNNRSRSNSPAARNVSRVNNSELNNSPHNSPSRWSFSATWPRNFMFRRNTSNDRSQNENRSRNTTPVHTNSTQNTEQFNNQATRNFSATWPRNITYQRNMMSWEDNETVGYLTTAVTTVTSDSVSQSNSSQATITAEQQIVMSSSSSESSHMGQQRLVSPPGGFDFELNPAYQPELSSQEAGNCHTDHKGRMYCPNLTHCTKQCHKNNDRKKSQDNSSGWLNVDPRRSASQASLSASAGDTSPSGAMSQYGSQAELEFPSDRSRVPPPTPEEPDQPGEAVPYSQPSIPFDFPCVEEIDPQPSCSYANINSDQEKITCSSIRNNIPEPENFCGRPPCTIGGSDVNGINPQASTAGTGGISYQFNENTTRVPQDVHSDLPCHNGHQMVTHTAYEQGHCMTYTYGMPPFYPPIQGCMDPRCMDPNCPNAAINGLPACGDPNCIDESCRSGFIYPCTDPNCTCSDVNQMCAPNGEQNMAPTLHVSTLPAYTIARPAVYGQSPTPSDKSITFPGVETHPKSSTGVVMSTSKQGSTTSSARSTPEKSRKSKKSQIKKKENGESVKSSETDEERFNREQSFTLANTGGIIYEVEGSLSPSSPRGLFSQSSSVNRPETYGQDSSPLSRVMPFSEFDLERSRSPKRDQQRRSSSSKEKGKSPQIKKRERSNSQKPVKNTENGPKLQKQHSEESRSSRSQACEEVPCGKQNVKKKENNEKLEENSEGNVQQEKKNSENDHFLVKARKSVENCNEDISGKKSTNEQHNVTKCKKDTALIPNCKVEQVSAIPSKNLPLKVKSKPPLMKKLMKTSERKTCNVDMSENENVRNEKICNSLSNDLVCKSDVPPENNLPGGDKMEKLCQMEHNNDPGDPISAVKAKSNKGELCTVIGRETGPGSGSLLTQCLNGEIIGTSLLVTNDSACPKSGPSKINDDSEFEDNTKKNNCDLIRDDCDVKESSNGILFDNFESNKNVISLITGDIRKDKDLVIAKNNTGRNKLTTGGEVLIRGEEILRDSTDKDNMVCSFPRETAANNFKIEPNSLNKHKKYIELLSKNNSRSQKDCLESSRCEFQSKKGMSGERYCDEFEIDYRARKNQYAQSLSTGVKSSAVKSCKMTATDNIGGQSSKSDETCVTKEIKGTAKSCLSALNENVDRESSSHFLPDHFSVNENAIITDHLLTDEGSHAGKFKDGIVSLDTDVAMDNRKKNRINCRENAYNVNIKDNSEKLETDACILIKKNQLSEADKLNKFIYNNNEFKEIKSECNKKSMDSFQTGIIKGKKRDQGSNSGKDLAFINAGCPSGDSPRDARVVLPILSESENSGEQTAEVDMLYSTGFSSEYKMGDIAAGKFPVTRVEEMEPGKDHSYIIRQDCELFAEGQSGSDNVSAATLSRKDLKKHGKGYIYRNKSRVPQEETAVTDGQVMELNTMGEEIRSVSDVSLPKVESNSQYCSVKREPSASEQIIGCKSDLDAHCGKSVARMKNKSQKWQNSEGLNTGIDFSIDDHSTRIGGLIGDQFSTKDRQGDNNGIMGKHNRIMGNSTTCQSNIACKDGINASGSSSTDNIDPTFMGNYPKGLKKRKKKLSGDKSSILVEKGQNSDFLPKNYKVIDKCVDQLSKCSLTKCSGYKKGDTVCHSCDEDITPGTSDQSSPNLVGNLCTRMETPLEATNSGCEFQCQNVRSTVEESSDGSSIVQALSSEDLPICTVNNCTQCAKLSGNCVPTYSYEACSLCPKYSQSNTSTSVPICSCGAPDCTQTVMSTGTPLQCLELCYCPECSTVPNCSMCHSICSIQQSNIHNCSTSNVISIQDYSTSELGSPVTEIHNVGHQIPIYVQGLTQYSQSYSTDCYGFTVHSGRNNNQPVLDVGHDQGQEVISRSHGSRSRSHSSKFTFEKCKLSQI